MAGQASNAGKVLQLERDTLERELSQAYQRRRDVSFGVDILEMPCDLSNETLHTERTGVTDFTEMFAGQPSRHGSRRSMGCTPPSRQSSETAGI